MNELEVTDAYMVVTFEYAESEIQARRHGGNYVNYFHNDEGFACNWQNGLVTDLDSLEVFAMNHLPSHLGIEDDVEGNE